MSLAKEIGAIVEQMPEKKQVLVFELVKTIMSPDDYLSDEDVVDILQARAEFNRDEHVRHEDIDWD